MQIEKNKNLKSFNTFAIEAFCNEFVKIEDEKDLLTVDFKDDKLILGGGSNVLITRNLEQVLFIANKGIQILTEDENKVELKVEAGEIWDEFVEFCVSKKWAGVENLSLIPGTVGASPIQNIGAYGVEVADVINKVRYFDIVEKEFKEIDNKTCRFDYRHSIFKDELKGKAIVTAVYFTLSKKPELKLNYGGLQDKLKDLSNPTIADVRKAVIEIRRSKLPDVNELGNSGSFFKNAIIRENKLCELSAKYPDLKYFKAPGGYKVPTAWLIEKAGLKGYRKGNAGVYEKHSLILVNYGGATAQEILDLAEFVENNVFEQFGIKIYKEVNVI